jgi:starch phosphorylase
MHLADLHSYTQAHQDVGRVYNDQEVWTKKAVINVAASAKFSSDRTIQQYAREIWGVEPCPIP